MASKTVKHLEVNLSKEVKDLYAKNYKILMKKIIEDSNGSVHHVLGLGE